MIMEMAMEMIMEMAMKMITEMIIITMKAMDATRTKITFEKLIIKILKIRNT